MSPAFYEIRNTKYVLPLPALQQQDTTGIATSYDSTWAADSATAATSTPAQSGMEAVMLSQDKIYVVLAVVLIIWIGIALFIWRTDRRLDRLEEQS